MLRFYALSLGLIIFVSVTLYLVVDEIRNFDLLIIASFCLTGLISAVCLLRSTWQDGISLRVVFWFFNLFCLSVAPVAQYLTGTWIFSVDGPSVLKANALILVYSSTFGVMHWRGRRRAARAVPVTPQSSAGLGPWRLFSLSLLSFCSAVALVAFVGFTWDSSLLSRAMGGTGLVAFVADFILRPLAFFVFLFVVLFCRTSTDRRLGYTMLALAFVGALLLNFPDTANRFYKLAIYFGLFTILFPPRRQNRGLHLSLLLLAISFVPQWLLSATRSESGFVLSDHYYSGNFDSYENFVHSINFVADNGIAWGRQLLGPILFWVPRETWPGKPIGTAAYVASSYLVRFFNVGYTNLSSPFIEEAYINFAIPGVIAFAGLLGVVCGFVDTKYKVYLIRLRHAYSKRERLILTSQSAYGLLYPVMLGLLLFMLRGDLLSSAAYTSGIVGAFVLVRIVV